MLAQSRQQWHELTHLMTTLGTRDMPPSTFNDSPIALPDTVRYTYHAGTVTAGKGMR